jgi:hypothetical protein
VKPTEQFAKSASTSKAGLFASLRGQLHVKGSGALSSRLILSVLAIVLGALAFTTAPALAAGLENPVTGAPSVVKAETATLNGVLSPASPGEVGSTYEFLYKASTAKECKGESRAPASPGMSLGGQEEPVSEPVTGLKPGTTYAVCLVAHNAAKTEEAVGPAVTFTTLPLPSAEVPSPIGATTATFRGKLTPLNEEVETQYIFFYNLGEEPACTYESAASPALENAGKGSGAKSVTTEVTGLRPNQKYTVCLFSFNAFGEEVSPASPAHFTTLPAPPEVVSGGESASPVKANEATLNAVINPNNESTKYKFEYSESATGETLNAPVTTVTGAPPAAELEGYGGQGVDAPTGTVLEANKTYYYRVVAENAQSETEAKPVDGPVRSFTTTTPSKEQASAITGTTATLNGVLNPAKAGEADSYEFLYRISPTECEGESASSYTSAPGGQGEPVKAELANLLPHTQYTFCLLARNELGEAAMGPAVTFTTLAAGLTGEASSEVGSTSAKLNAQIDPGGAETTYYVEYGPTEAYGSSTPEVSAGAGTEYSGVQATLEGLQHDTVYHYRFVAKSSFGTAPGPDATFTTFPPSASALPDDRGYELVSTFAPGTPTEAFVPWVQFGYIDLEEHGIHALGRPFRVAPDGEAVVFPGGPPPAGGNGGAGVGTGTEYLAERTSKGWEANDIQPPAATKANSYLAFSSDLSVGIFRASGNELGGGSDALEDFYSHATVGGAGGEYHPLYTGTPPNRALSEWGAVYAGGNAGTSAVPAFSDLLFEANDALPTINVAADGGKGEDPVTHRQYASEKNLYDRVGGGLYLVNVLPDGSTEAYASFGQFSSTGRAGSNLVSADGSRIFWTDRNTGALYVRENATQSDAGTVLVAEGGEPRFWAADREGSLAFYTKGGDLYEFDVETGQSTDLSVALHSSESAKVQGVVGTSEDGGYVYFAADGVLTAGENAEGKAPVSGQPNLYLAHEGTTAFVATLDSADGDEVQPVAGNNAGPQGDWQPGGGHRTTDVTPDGHSIVFMSNRPLTGYDPGTQTTLTGEPLDEVFLFQAQSGKLTCVSCNPSGEPPVPTEFNTHLNDLPIGGFIPTTVSAAGEQTRVISEDGDRVFFDSGEPLLPTATNGWLNVYEWERAGTPGGSCPEGAPHGGCVYLISSGIDPETSYLLGADASGANVFFISRAQLVSSDHGNEGYEVYDARVGGGQPPAEAACEGTGCQGVPPTPPIFATPASVTFTGIGNFPPSPPAKPAVKPKTKTVKCKKGDTKKKKRCVKTKKKKKTKVKKNAKKSSNNLVNTNVKGKRKHV